MLGHDLLILPFDHRGTFVEKLFGGKGRRATTEETNKIKEFKEIIFDGFLKACNLNVPKNLAGILVDEEFGSKVLIEAKKRCLAFAMPLEKSGQEEFDFEYPDWQAHIKNFSPTYTKVLVRYNPEGERAVNLRQLEKLKLLNDYLKSANMHFLFELLVPATANQLSEFGGEKESYDLHLRPKLMVKAMAEIQHYGILPDLWKLEGVERKEDAELLVKQARSAPKPAGIITLGRGESIDKVREWLKVGAHTDGIVGFAVGRTIFWDAIEKFHRSAFNRQQAISQIADNYSSFVKLWLEERKNK